MSKPYQAVTQQSTVINLMPEPVVIVDWSSQSNYVVFEPLENINELNVTREQPDVFYIVSADTAKALALFTGRNDILYPDGECRDKQQSLLGYFTLASYTLLDEPRATYDELNQE